MYSGEKKMNSVNSGRMIERGCTLVVRTADDTVHYSRIECGAVGAGAGRSRDFDATTTTTRPPHEQMGMPAGSSRWLTASHHPTLPPWHHASSVSPSGPRNGHRPAVQCRATGLDVLQLSCRRFRGKPFAATAELGMDCMDIRIRIRIRF